MGPSVGSLKGVEVFLWGRSLVFEESKMVFAESCANQEAINKALMRAALMRSCELCDGVVNRR